MKMACEFCWDRNCTCTQTSSKPTPQVERHTPEQKAKRQAEYESWMARGKAPKRIYA
jgi:hypothetical protein